jgi:hypothetical protein
VAVSPQQFVAVPKRGGPRVYKTAPVRRETDAEQCARQIVFEHDQQYIQENLRPGKAKFARQITLGA